MGRGQTQLCLYPNRGAVSYASESPPLPENDFIGRILLTLRFDGKPDFPSCPFAPPSVALNCQSPIITKGNDYAPFAFSPCDHPLLHHAPFAHRTRRQSATHNYDRSIVKEPAYQSTPKYCLITIGNNANQVWMVEDGQRLFVDKNANGDLTDDGPPLEPSKSGTSTPIAGTSITCSTPSLQSMAHDTQTLCCAAGITARRTIITACRFPLTVRCPCMPVGSATSAHELCRRRFFTSAVPSRPHFLDGKHLNPYFPD